MGRLETSDASNLPHFQSCKQTTGLCVSFFIVNILLLTLLMLQSSCYTAPYYDTPDNNPMSQLEQKYSIYLDATWTKKQMPTHF